MQTYKNGNGCFIIKYYHIITLFGVEGFFYETEVFKPDLILEYNFLTKIEAHIDVSNRKINYTLKNSIENTFHIFQKFFSKQKWGEFKSQEQKASIQSAERNIGVNKKVNIKEQNNIKLPCN